MRLSENAHLPFGRPFDKPFDKVEGLTALSKVEGLRYLPPSSLRCTSMYALFLGILEALHLDIFHQPLRSRFFQVSMAFLSEVHWWNSFHNGSFGLR
jgi:hypothetical protein